MEGEITMGLREKIQQTLNTREENNRKSVSLIIDSDTLEQVDRVAKAFSKVSEKNFSRNSIIEEAIKEYIVEATDVLLNTYSIDINETNEDDTISTDFNLAIFPAHNDGFNETFIGEDCWYSVRIKEERIPKIKYVAAYRAAPVSGITHYAKVREIKQYEDTKKKIVIFDGPAIPLPHTIKLGGTDANAMRAPRYTTLEKFQQAQDVKELFK